MKPMLVIGNKNYSSWSLRAWLALRAGQPGAVEFDELRLPLDTAEFRSRIGEYSPSGQVPALHHDGLLIWDSLAICEYAAGAWPQAAQWPTAVAARAYARSACAEMHAGFGALRRTLPMNIRRPVEHYPINAEARRDVDRVCRLWQGCRALADTAGPYLFGTFGIADAMFAPVVSRFVTYQVAVDDDASKYLAAVMSHAAMQSWCEAARAETEVVSADEV